MIPWRRHRDPPVDVKIAYALAERARSSAAAEADQIILPPDLELQEICRQVVAETSATSAFISVVLKNRQIVKAGWNLPDSVPLGKPVPLAYSVCAYVVAHDRPQITSSVRNNVEMRNCLVDVGAYLGVPLHYKKQPIGALGTIADDGHAWPEADLTTVGAFARWVEMSVRLRSGTEPVGSPVSRNP